MGRPKRYKKLKINQVYSVKYKNKIRRYKYTGRFLNKITKDWIYSFESLDGLEYFTPQASKVEVWQI